MAPKDEKIVNKDDAVTNTEAGNNLEKGKQESIQQKPDEQRVPTVTPDNENGAPGPSAEKPAVEKGNIMGEEAER